ncbi:MAG: mannose-1-phosphate guanylyltransferase/mannose-6-phosphate isomerase [Proteobacteria bacterium]|jgi:mannose-1-phosphate guanylyltransferase|nr:mannose-1-phosphate guanylyltransferase/mannose-6-phosphate isomerase [Pseudomonadota bacterium]
MIPVIISGGSGSRLWPVSRQLDPKPFLQLSDGKSLLQNTFSRAMNLPQVKNILTITNESLHFRMQDEYQQINSKNINCDFILEPFGKNTAPAVINACLYAQKHYGNDEIILILPADHLISDSEAFTQAVTQATKIAQDGYIATFGINPEYAETGYGYIEADKSQAIDNGYKIKRFVEKPNQKTAEEYLHSGNYLWNSGMFCGKVSTFLSELEVYSKQLLHDSKECLENSEVDKIKNSKITHLNSNYFKNIENISIDYSLFEKSTQTAVLPCSIGWSDIGSWLSIAQTLPKDNKNNAVIGENILHNATNCLVYSTNRIVAGVDIDNLIIVDTPDALLVADKKTSQNVKHIFEKLKLMEHKTSELHQTAHRPWGTYTVLEEDPCYKIKRIEVKPGALLSLQMHHHRSEHWIVVAGTATVTNGDMVLELNANESIYIPVETKHRLENKTDKNLTLIEVQCGTYLGEDDIVRFEDKYGRTQ